MNEKILELLIHLKNLAENSIQELSKYEMSIWDEYKLINDLVDDIKDCAIEIENNKEEDPENYSSQLLKYIEDYRKIKRVSRGNVSA